MKAAFIFFHLLVSAAVEMAYSKMCDSAEFRLIEAKFGNEKHFLCLKLQSVGSSPIASSDATLFLEPDVDYEFENQEYNREWPLTDIYMAYGYPLEDPSSGSAEGYIGDDEQFHGMLYMRNRTLYADPSEKGVNIFGAFENDNMAPPRRRRAHVQINQDHFLSYHFEEHPRIVGSARSRICDLLLLGDKSFYENDANSSLNEVVRRMMHAVAQADLVFRNADFDEDGVPDNIGFSVKYILVLTSNETNARVFGELLDSPEVNGREYLMRFARLRRLSEVCLGVAFSGHAFQNRTLGLSFTSLGGGIGSAAGGLCDRRAYGRSFNTLAISHATTENSDRVPERIAALTLTHEMGHSFGAHHDDHFPNSDCRGYIMGSQSTTTENRTFLEFSICSKRLISATLSSMSYCFTEESKPYCGNGIVEEGEACDCGLPSRCSNMDPCCTPRAGGASVSEQGSLHKEGCSVAPTAKCHPSQGLCCMGNCQYADLTKIGINCPSQNEECTCNNSLTCKCGLGGRCLPDWSCHAAECALLGMRECQCCNTPGGAIVEQHKCGICCMFEARHHRPKCVGAEQAAHMYIENSIDGKLPLEWPGNDIVGPNISVNLCSYDKCEMVTMRAWMFGSPCVTLGAVGMCTALGVCSRVIHTPRSNIYPDIMRATLRKERASNQSNVISKCSIFLLIISGILNI